MKAKPSTPTVPNSRPEANLKKEYEDLAVTAQTSQRPSKAGTPTLNTSLLKKRNYDQFLQSNNIKSNLQSTVEKSKPKLSTTTMENTYDYRVTPQSEMKSNQTPTKQAHNEVSCEVTSQALGDTCMKNPDAYKRTCSGFGDESVSQTPVSKQQSKVYQGLSPSIFGMVQDISPIR